MNLKIGHFFIFQSKVALLLNVPIKASDLPDELKEKVDALTPPLPDLASNDNTAVKGNPESQKKEYLEKINELAEDAEAFSKINNTEPLIIFVNGYWKEDGMLSNGRSLEGYWRFKEKGEYPLRISAKKYFNTNHEFFINGASDKYSDGKERYKKGSEYASNRLSNTNSEFFKLVKNNNRKIMIITHSMGAAFAEGVIKEMAGKGIQIEKVIHFSPADPSDFSVTLPNVTYQLDVYGDLVLTWKNFDDSDNINNIKFKGVIESPNKWSDKLTSHADTREDEYVWNSFVYLESVKFENIGEESFNGSYKTKFKAINFKVKANLIKITKEGVTYLNSGSENQYYTLRKN